MLTDPNVEAQLAAWTRDWYGSGAGVMGVAPMPGNSGISYGFQVTGVARTTRLVLRMPHPRAQRMGNADMTRQVAVLRACEQGGVPVPGVVAAGGGSESLFGVPYYVVRWVEGESTHLFDPTKAAENDGSRMEVVFDHALEVLARIHDVDWGRALPVWTVIGLQAEIDRWVPTLHKAQDPEWVEIGAALRSRLLATLPPDDRVGLVHGDYYSNNWLYRDGRVQAVVDWEIASIGSTGIDVGWLCMMYDPESWGPSRHSWTAWSPTPAWIEERYTRASGQPVQHLGWYRALAGYRMGCITARALALHRSGKAVDPAWDILGEAFIPMMRRATDLLD